VCVRSLSFQSPTTPTSKSTSLDIFSSLISFLVPKRPESIVLFETLSIYPHYYFVKTSTPLEPANGFSGLPNAPSVCETLQTFCPPPFSYSSLVVHSRYWKLFSSLEDHSFPSPGPIPCLFPRARCVRIVPLRSLSRGPIPTCTAVPHTDSATCFRPFSVR